MHDHDLSTRTRDLHEHLVARSRTAAADLLVLLAAPLVNFLRRRHPSLGEEAAHDIVYDALTGYTLDPERCDPSLASPWTWLCGVVDRDALDCLAKRARRAKIDMALTPLVEEWHRHANQGDDGGEERAVEEFEYENQVSLTTNAAERAVLRLMMEGERETAVYAEALGLDPVHPDTAAEVKRVKDRIKGRGRR